jgi:hypothetical protein
MTVIDVEAAGRPCRHRPRSAIAMVDDRAHRHQVAALRVQPLGDDQRVDADRIPELALAAVVLGVAIETVTAGAQRHAWRSSGFRPRPEALPNAALAKRTWAASDGSMPHFAARQLPHQSEVRQIPPGHFLDARPGLRSALEKDGRAVRGGRCGGEIGVHDVSEECLGDQNDNGASVGLTQNVMHFGRRRGCRSGAR